MLIFIGRASWGLIILASHYSPNTGSKLNSVVNVMTIGRKTNPTRTGKSGSEMSLEHGLCRLYLKKVEFSQLIKRENEFLTK